MKSKLIISLVILILVGGTAFKLISNKQIVEEKIYQPEANKRVIVEADTVSSQSFQRTYTYTGAFAPNREAMIIPQMQGQVEGIYFEEGDIVHQGKLLVKIDDELLISQRIGAEANYQTAVRTADRYENALESGGVSGLQVDNSRLNLKTTESQLKQLNKQISWSRIAAPFTGTITMKDVEMGSVIGSAPIARITDLSKLKLEISVPESEISNCKEGDQINIETAVYPGKTIKGNIEYISDRADHAHNYLVRIIINNDQKSLDLKAGMYGSASLTRSINAEAIAIPRTALVGSQKAPQVFVLENGKAILRDIHIGQSNESFIEVLDGIVECDIVIISGHINLANGSNVQVAL